ncbi:sigma 54-interacting transcriptional regulator [uncultured Marinobacter sp.]|uniref:sigma-54 interaction domain-containing protein n=1 Tax=uncultured Marinobacter sp. TaxID=187379 RepID=UPI0030DAA672
MSARQDHHDDLELESLLLAQAAQLFGSSLDLSATIPAVLRLMSQLVGLNRGRVVVPDGDGQALRIRYAYGLTEDERRRGVYAPGEGVTGQVMASGRVSVVQNVDDEGGYLFRAVDRQTLPEGTVCFIAMPIVMDGDVLGVLACHRLRDRPRPFRADLHLLQILAAMFGQALRIQELVARRTEQLEEQNQALRSALAEEVGAHGVIGNSVALRHALEQALRIAPADATVMLQGESGTGKERFARLIHDRSPRHREPFICINCAAIPENLLEAELFGHEKGAFTGAVRARIGKVELADGGTLFLDEIGDMNLELQAKLLRLLQEKTLQRVGGDRDIPVNLRVITATHQDLQRQVNEGRFRLDLFYRLNVIPLMLPPLRQRSGDIRLLALHFLNMFNRRHCKHLEFGDGVIERLESFDWPGNIRQLENVIERAVLMGQTRRIDAGEMEQLLGMESAVEGHDRQASISGIPETAGLVQGWKLAEGAGDRPYQKLSDTDPETIRSAVARCRGNKTRAARELGLTARQLHYRIQKLGLEDNYRG